MSFYQPQSSWQQHSAAHIKILRVSFYCHQMHSCERLVLARPLPLRAKSCVPVTPSQCIVHQDMWSLHVVKLVSRPSAGIYNDMCYTRAWCTRKQVVYGTRPICQHAAMSKTVTHVRDTPAITSMIHTPISCYDCSTGFLTYWLLMWRV